MPRKDLHVVRLRRHGATPPGSCIIVGARLNRPENTHRRVLAHPAHASIRCAVVRVVAVTGIAALGRARVRVLATGRRRLAARAAAVDTVAGVRIRALTAVAV